MLNNLNKKAGLIAILASVAASELMAGTLTSYSTGDVLICFRKGNNDMVVDAGSISTFTNLAINQRYAISTYSTGTQLNQVGINSMSWSVFTWLSDDTLFLTRARSSLNTQTAPWYAGTASVQSGTIGRMATIPPGAVDESTLAVYPNDSSTAVVEEDFSSGNPNYTTGVSYHDALKGAYGGNFNGTFQGNPENTTANNFTTSGQVVRSDFYQLTPSSIYPNGKLLGYFELATDGTMTYVAYPIAIPVINSITRSGTTTTITYTTGLYGTYTLRGTNSLTSGTAQINWPVVATLSSGDTLTHIITDTTSDPVKYYTITAQ